MKRLLFVGMLVLVACVAKAQNDIICQAYYHSTPNRNLPNVAVTARAANGTILGSCNTGSSGQCVISGGSSLLAASYQFTNGYERNVRLASGDTIIRAGFDESFVRESPTITEEVEDAPSSSYPEGFVQTGNYVYYRAFTTNEGFQVWRYNVVTNVQQLIPLPSVTVGNVAKIWLAGSRLLVYADQKFYVVTNLTTLTPSISAALSGVPSLPNPENSVLVGGDYLYFASFQGLTELEISTSTFTPINVFNNAGAANLIFHPGTNYIYFTAANTNLGQDHQLWRVFNGGYTATKISNLNSPVGAGIQDIVDWNGRLYFSADTPALGRELYRTTADGSGVELFLNIVTGATSSNVSTLTPAVSAALGQNELYLTTDQLGLARVSTTGVVSQVVDAASSAIIRTDRVTYTPTRGVLFCNNSSANAFYEHVFGTLNATNLTTASNLQLHNGYNEEIIPLNNGIMFVGKKTNGDSYLGTVSYFPVTFGSTTFWPRLVSTIRTFSNSVLPSYINYPKINNLALVGSRVYFSALNEANKGFEPWYYSSSTSPTTQEMPEVNTLSLGITNSKDIHSVSYGNYLYYNAEYYAKSGLEMSGNVQYQESVRKTLGNQRSKYFSEFSPTPDITSLKMAGSKIYASSVGLIENQIFSKDLTTNASYDYVTADIVNLDNSSAIGNTLYFLSLPKAAGSTFRRLWRTDGTTAGTSTIDTENTTYTGTYAWNGGLFYAKNNGAGAGGLYRYNPTINSVSTISTGGVFVSQFTEFAGTLFYRASAGAGFGSLRRTDGSTSSNVVVATYTYEDVNIKLVGNRLVVAIKSSTTANWEIRSTTDGVNFVSHFSGLAADFTMIGGSNGVLLGTTTAISPFLTAYNLNTNTSTTMGTGAFYAINFFPAIDDTDPAAPIYYLAMELTSTSGYYLYKTTLTSAGASALTAVGASWVKVINRKSYPWQTLHRIGKKIFFLGEDADKSRGIEMWVYNPDRCTNALTLASFDDNQINSPYDTETSKKPVHYLTNTSIQATNKLTNATVLYRAGQSVTFLPGFEAGTSPPDMFIPRGTGSFEAQIGGCGTLVPR